VLGIWLALRYCDALARVLLPLLRNYTFTVVLCFVLILALIWLGLKLLHLALTPLLDWSRFDELDRFLGGFLGLAQATAIVWAFLALGLSAFPPLARVIGQSNASVRILSFGERASGPQRLSGEMARLPDPFQGLNGAFSLIEKSRHRFDGAGLGE